jgi:hypothetical protein
LISLLDEDGCRVTLRMSRAVADTLCARLAQPPDSPAAG